MPGRNHGGAVVSYISRESYAQCNSAWRCRGRHAQSPRAHALWSCATWRRTARQRRICRSSSGPRRPM